MKLLVIVSISALTVAGALHLDIPKSHALGQTTECGSSRRDFVSMFAAAGLIIVPEYAEAKSYSSNARNMERMNSGDMSGGSTYDNNPKSEAGKRRRAITGCKSPVAREEAAENSLGVSSLSEKQCNQVVLDGDSEFMLQALRKLDCPSCPYGIAASRN